MVLDISYLHMNLAEVLGVSIGLNHRHLLATVLNHCGRIGTSHRLGIGISGIGHGLTGIQESMRMSTNHDVHLWAVLGDLLILLVARVTQSNDDINVLGL